MLKRFSLAYELALAFQVLASIIIIKNSLVIIFMFVLSFQKKVNDKSAKR